MHDSHRFFTALAVAISAPLAAQAQATHWCTYLGGAADQESIQAVALAQNGDVLVAGWTRSSDFPVTPGCYDSVRDGVEDVFVARLSSDGSQILAATYLGGSAKDEARFVEEAPDGTIWVGGTSASSTFPTTADAFATPGSGNDAFVVQLDASLTTVIYGTTFGGASGDNGDRFVVDHANSRICLAGRTNGSVPVTASGFQQTKSVSTDWFFVVLDRGTPGTTSLAYGTYLGGNSVELEVDTLSVDSNGVATITAATSSSSLPTTASAFQGYSGSNDGYVARIDPSQQGAASLVHASYFGGSGPDNRLLHAVDANGRLHLVLNSTSSDLPLTPNAVVTTRGTNSDVYYARIDPAASGSAALEYGSWLLANGFGEEVFAVAYSGGDLAMFHWVNGPLPGTPGSLIPGWSWRTQYHGYVQVLDVTGQPVPGVRYASHYEGCTANTFPRAIAFDGLEVVLAGHGQAPVTPGAVQPRAASATDAFVGRLGLGAWPSPFETFGNSCAGTAGTPILAGTVPARLCGSLELRATALRPLSVGILTAGFSRTQWSGVPLPLALDFLGAPGCQVHVEILATANRSTGASGAVTMSFPIPGAVALVGESMLFQFVVFDPGANPAGLVTTNGLRAEARW